jgi:cobalt-zinc-cadmium efflux system protein
MVAVRRQAVSASSHTMSHSHAGHNHADRGKDRRRLAWTLVLIGSYAIAELLGGWYTNSLALLADAGHMLSDAAALALSLFALWIATRPANPRRTYGYYRAEILAALVNAATLIAISVYIFVEAWQRLREPPEVLGLPMMAIAVGGLIVNLIALALLHSGSSTSLNVRGAWLHVLGDALGSVGAIVAGVAIWWGGWLWVDPLVSVFIGLLVIYSSWALMQEAVAVLMESTPNHLDVDKIRSAMLAADGVEEVHDLHVWTITSGFESLSAHVVVNGEREYCDVLRDLRTLLARQFHVDHVTIQIEPTGFHEHRPHV